MKAPVKAAVFKDLAKITWTPEILDQWWALWKEFLPVVGLPLSPYQEEIVRCLNNKILVAGGEQAGKSWLAAAYTFCRLWHGKIYWLVGDDYSQTEREFDYIKDALLATECISPDDVSAPQRGPRSIKIFNRIRIVTKSAKDIRKLGKEAPDGILMCEAAQMGYDVYSKCRGRIAPKGGWLLLIGTFEATTDWYAHTYKRWQAHNPENGKAFCLPAWANPAFYPKGRQDPKILAAERELSPEDFAMRFEARLVPPPDLIFPMFRYDIHVPGGIEFDPEKPVQIWGDPGWSGSWYSLEIVQLVGPDRHCKQDHVHVIDEVRVKYATTPEIAQACRERDWWEKVELAVLDVAAKQHHGAGESVAEAWGAEGIPVDCNRIDVEAGIARHRTFLKDPVTGEARIFFNSSCLGAFEEYGKWKKRKVVDGQNAEAKAQRVNCDSLKALSYGLISNFGHAFWETEAARLVDPFS
jgi:hypothetical protein